MHGREGFANGLGLDIGRALALMGFTGLLKGLQWGFMVWAYIMGYNIGAWRSCGVRAHYSGVVASRWLWYGIIYGYIVKASGVWFVSSVCAV